MYEKKRKSLGKDGVYKNKAHTNGVCYVVEYEEDLAAETELRSGKTIS